MGIVRLLEILFSAIGWPLRAVISARRAVRQCPCVGCYGAAKELATMGVLGLVAIALGAAAFAVPLAWIKWTMLAAAVPVYMILWRRASEQVQLYSVLRWPGRC